MKHKVLSLIAALTMILCIFAAVPAQASAASQRVHDGETFTISASTFLKYYQDALDNSDCFYKLSLAEDLSDCNAQYYIMYDENDNYEMEMVLYTNYETKKLETVRFYCKADRLSDLSPDRQLLAMLVAYDVANPEMTAGKWVNMFTEQTRFDDGGGYIEGYYGEFDGVNYTMEFQSGAVNFSIV